MSAERQPPRWQSLRDAAAASMARNTVPPGQGSGQPAAGPAGPPHLLATARTTLATLEHRVREALRARRTAARPLSSDASSGSRRRTDLRLVPAALLVWGTALAGGWLAPTALAFGCAALATAAGILLAPHRRRRKAGARSLRGTAAAALLLSCAAGAHAAVASVPRNEGAVAEAVAAGASVVAEIE
ncbi:hypothetical protein AB4Y86_19220, partial [Arthrobacter sp. 2YAF22_2]